MIDEHHDALESELEHLRDEVERLSEDRDRWREQARSWRLETQRLFELSEGRISRRARRLGFRVARDVWRALPRRLREVVRPLALPTPKVAASVPAPGRLPGRPRPHGDSEKRSFSGTVSVVIPTLNAGAQFERVLHAIKRQEGVTVELVVVDSGSMDGTPERAAAAGAYVEAIPPAAFGHGRTRDRGAELTTGDVIVMMVQDATLLGATALRDLAFELASDPNLAGVSARQVARANADLFGAFLVWSHYRALWPHSGKTEVPLLSERASIGLDNVCAAIARPAWEAVRFADVDFAEDIDFAVRARANGWSFALSPSAAVAHSHTRDSLYHLQRKVADCLFVAPLVGDNQLSRAAGEEPDQLLAAGHALLPEIQGALSLRASSDPQSLAVSLRTFAATLAGGGGVRMSPAGELARLGDFLAERNGHGYQARAVDLLRRELLAQLRWQPVEEFALAHNAVDAAETSDFVAKATASVIGRAVGDSMRRGAAAVEAAGLLQGI